MAEDLPEKQAALLGACVVRSKSTLGYARSPHVSGSSQ